MYTVKKDIRISSSFHGKSLALLMVHVLCPEAKGGILEVSGSQQCIHKCMPSLVGFDLIGDKYEQHKQIWSQRQYRQKKMAKIHQVLSSFLCDHVKTSVFEEGQSIGV